MALAGTGDSGRKPRNGNTRGAYGLRYRVFLGFRRPLVLIVQQVKPQLLTSTTQHVQKPELFPRCNSESDVSYTKAQGSWKEWFFWQLLEQCQLTENSSFVVVVFWIKAPPIQLQVYSKTVLRSVTMSGMN